MSRRRPSLRPPRPGQDLSDFPTERLVERALLYRAHHADYDNPWYFADDDSGRFNLSGEHGTCYAAESISTAIRERFGVILVDSGAIEEDLAELTAVTDIVIEQHTEVAAVSHPDAVHYFTREICTSYDYSITRAWAQVFAQAELDGIHYESRFTTDAHANAWALFDVAGESDRPYVAESRRNGASACAAAGLRVVPSELDDSTAQVVEPPQT